MLGVEVFYHPIWVFFTALLAAVVYLQRRWRWDPKVCGVRLQGKVAVVTGANTGECPSIVGSFCPQFFWGWNVNLFISDLVIMLQPVSPLLSLNLQPSLAAYFLHSVICTCINKWRGKEKGSFAFYLLSAASASNEDEVFLRIWDCSLLCSSLPSSENVCFFSGIYRSAVWQHMGKVGYCIYGNSMSPKAWHYLCATTL